MPMFKIIGVWFKYDMFKHKVFSELWYQTWQINALFQ